MKKIVVITVVAVAVIIVINLLFASKADKKNKYDFIKESPHLNDYLFNKNARNKLSLISAMGNKQEKIFFYRFDKNYNLIVWNIKGFSKVDLSKIHLYKIKNFNSILINPQRFFEMGYFKVISKTEQLKSNKLTIYTSDNANILNHFEKTDTAYLNIVSNGLILGNKNKFFIKLISKNPFFFNLLFIKNPKGFHFIILSSKNKMRGNMLLSIVSKVSATVLLPAPASLYLASDK